MQAPRGARPVATPQRGAAHGSEPSEAASQRSLGRLYLRLLGTAALVVGLDQSTKQWALNNFADKPWELIEGVLRFRLTYNSGGAFGLLQGLPGFFLVATLVIVGAILIGARKIDDPRWAIPLGLVLGGGLGNAADRLLRDTGGGVVDFIDLHVWPVFNVADMAIVFGALVILLLGWGASDGENGSE